MQSDLELLRSLAALMGWEVREQPISGKGYDFSKGDVFLDRDGSFWRATHAETPGWGFLFGDGSFAIRWRPLHDMNDAMGVVDRLIEQHDCAFILDWDYNHSGKWHAGFGIASDEFPDAVADTPQRAIALAALETREEG